MAPTKHVNTLELLKHTSKRKNYPYTSLRDAALRGEFRVFLSGQGDRYCRMYVEPSEIDHWFDNKMEVLT